MPDRSNAATLNGVAQCASTQLRRDFVGLHKDLVARHFGLVGMDMRHEPALAAMLDIDIGGLLTALDLAQIGENAGFGFGGRGNEFFHDVLAGSGAPYGRNVPVAAPLCALGGIVTSW